MVMAGQLYEHKFPFISLRTDPPIMLSETGPIYAVPHQHDECRSLNSPLPSSQAASMCNPISYRRKHDH